MAAAPNDEMMIVRNEPALSVARISPSSTPDAAANTVPMIQARQRTRLGSCPGVEQRRVVDHRPHLGAACERKKREDDPAARATPNRMIWS
jgi:hypothetical protein